MDFNANNFDFDLSEFKIVWVHSIPFFIPNYLSITQEKYLIASQLTLLLQNTSVDNVLKKWMVNFEKDRHNQKKDIKFSLLEEVLDFARQQNYLVYKRLKGINFNPETESSLACDAVFARLQTTMNAIHFHLKFGYYYESFTLIRLFLEQLAYAYTSSMVATKEIQEFVSPTQSINYLKKFIPNAGRIYGRLSKLSHLDTSTINKYLVIKEGKIFTVHHSIYFSFEAAMYYLEILEYQHLVFEYSFRNYLKNFEYINKEENGKFISKKKFSMRTKKERYQNKMQKILIENK